MFTNPAFQVASIRHSVQYLNVASLTVFVFDYFHTLSLEVELVWKSSWSISKIVFLLARYPTFVDVPLMVYYTLGTEIAYETCSLLNTVATWSMAFGIAMSHVILLLRTFALWGNNVKILLFLVSLFVAIYIPALTILTIFLRSTKHGAPPLSTIHGCYPVAGSDILFVDFVLIILYESAVMVLTLWVWVKLYRHSRNRLVITLYRDGILFSICIFAISCAYIIVLVACPPEYADLLTTFQHVMHSLLTTRILLNVRKTAQSQAYLFNESTMKV